jgi:hypothetical protein
VSETVGAAVLIAGVVLTSIAWIWLLVLAFRTRLWWGLVSVFLPPMLIVFALAFWKKTRWPSILLVTGLLVGAVPFAVNAVQERVVGLGKYESQVNGEWHVTVTGWDQKDYSVLKTRHDAVVVQMANPDVTDQTLEILRDFQNLRELDLNDTAVTDVGLATIAALPKLQALRMKNTKITDEGFQLYLAGKESLLQLDLRGTPVAGKSLREWKNAQPGREYLR